MKWSRWASGTLVLATLVAAPALAEVDPDAMAVLQRMTGALAQAEGFKVDIASDYDVTQDNGQKISFGERRTVTLKRPDRLRVEARGSDGRSRVVQFDGKALTVSDPELKVYAQVEKAGSIDDAVRHLVQDLQMKLPLALLLVSTLPQELEDRLQDLVVVERDTLTPVPTDHLAGRTAEVDFEVWVAAEGPPMPQRVIITYKGEKGDPQYRARFSEWAMNPEVTPESVTFTPAEGVERIPFMVRVARAKGGSSKAATKGASK